MTTSFNWYELMTSDVEAAKRFYGQVVGWEMEGFDPSGDYTVLKAGGRGVGGLTAIPAEAAANGVRPVWIGYIAVADVDCAAEEIRHSGGKLHMGMKDIPGAGRIAMVSDPQGAPFYVIAPDGEDEPPAAPMTSGHVGWHELHTSDWEAAFDFYSGRFGWEKDEALNMGPTGIYQLFRAGGGNAIGGMYNAETFGRPAWLFYFVVGNIDEAASRVAGAGGEVVEEPMEVPGGAWVIQCRDPQGAMFALVGMRR